MRNSGINYQLTNEFLHFLFLFFSLFQNKIRVDRLGGIYEQLSCHSYLRKMWWSHCVCLSVCRTTKCKHFYIIAFFVTNKICYQLLCPQSRCRVVLKRLSFLIFSLVDFSGLREFRTRTLNSNNILLQSKWRQSSRWKSKIN